MPRYVHWTFLSHDFLPSASRIAHLPRFPSTSLVAPSRFPWLLSFHSLDLYTLPYSRAWSFPRYCLSPPPWWPRLVIHLYICDSKICVWSLYLSSELQAHSLLPPWCRSAPDRAYGADRELDSWPPTRPGPAPAAVLPTQWTAAHSSRSWDENHWSHHSVPCYLQNLLALTSACIQKLAVSHCLYYYFPYLNVFSLIVGNSLLTSLTASSLVAP